MNSHSRTRAASGQRFIGLRHSRPGRLVVRTISSIIQGTMPYVWKDRESLARIEEEIAAGQKRVAEQIHVIQWLMVNGHDTAEARKRLQDDEQALRNYREHRLNLLEEIVRQEEPEL